MIAKVAPARKSGRGSFSDLRNYLERDKDGQQRQDLVATWSGHVMSHATADVDMERIAAKNQLNDPVHHLILSWRPHEEVGLDVARSSIEAVLRSGGMEDHQWYAALHQDESDGRTHLHLMVNRVRPVTYRALDVWHSNAKLARAAEWIEREHGCLVDRRMAWREYVPEVDLGFSITAAEAHVREMIAPGIHAEPPGAEQSEMDAVRRAGYSWATLLQQEAVPAALAAIEAPEASWNDLHTALETYGVHLERAGSGLRIVGHEPGQHLKASRAGLVFRELEERLGSYVASPKAASNFRERIEQAKEVIVAAKSWDDLYVALGDLYLAIEKRGKGGRITDLTGTGRTVPLMSVDTSMKKLEKRFGEYALSQVLLEKIEREAVRRHEAVAERLTAIGADTTPLLARVSAHYAVWRPLDVELEIARVVGVTRDELCDRHAAGLEGARDRVLAASELVGEEKRSHVDAQGVERTERIPLYSTRAIIEEERLTWESVGTIAERRRELTLRAPSLDLDEQQRAAYEHLADGGSDLRVATGIAGAGKSRLLRELCAAYAEAGYEVIGTAVAGSAARVLGEEAHIPARTMAKLLLDIEGGRQRLNGKSVIVVDEASMLGTKDARRLFEAARDSGARVLLLGDRQQHEAVARGPVLSEIVERHAACDLGTTRRAQEQWLRDVGMDLRAGRTTRAMDMLRANGCIAEHESTQEAMGALVDRYAQDVRAGREALLIATRRGEVEQLNEMVREVLRGQFGDERAYATAFGERSFAVGDRVVTREPDRKTGTVNGDTWTVSAHGKDEQNVELVRERDGLRVTWDLRERPALDYGYATTSYRSQGQTVDSVHVLASQADEKRGLYVNVTRARQNVTIAYGRDELADFGRLLDVAGRDREKPTVAAVERATGKHAPQTEQSVEASLPETRAEDASILRIRSSSDERPWGAHEHMDAYAHVVERTRLRYAWKIARGDGEVVLRNSQGEIHDRGSEIAVSGHHDMAMQSIVELAFQKRWTGIAVQGGSQELRRELAAEARRHGISLTELDRPQRALTQVEQRLQSLSMELKGRSLVIALDQQAKAVESPTNLRIRSASDEQPWGKHATMSDYAHVVERTTLRYAWKITRGDGEITLRNSQGEIRDRGGEIEVSGDHGLAMRSIVELAAEKQWTSIVVEGGSDDLRSELVTEARRRGIAVTTGESDDQQSPQMEQGTDAGGHSEPDETSQATWTNLRICSSSNEPPWGAHATMSDYAYVVERTRLRYAWKITRGDDEIVLRNSRGEIHDRGSRIEVSGDHDLAMRSIVELAVEKRWTSIMVEGGSEEQRRELMTEARGHGIAVMGGAGGKSPSLQFEQGVEIGARSEAEAMPEESSSTVRIRSSSNEQPWGNHATMHDYAYVVERTRLRYAWKIVRGDGEITLRNSQGEIHDRGSEIEASGDHGLAMRSMVELAAEKQWTSIAVDGGSDELRGELAFEARRHGISITFDGVEVTGEMADAYERQIDEQENANDQETTEW